MVITSILNEISCKPSQSPSCLHFRDHYGNKSHQTLYSVFNPWWPVWWPCLFYNHADMYCFTEINQIKRYLGIIIRPPQLSATALNRGCQMINYWLYTQSLLTLHSISIDCTLNLYWLYTQSLLIVHSISIDCTLNRGYQILMYYCSRVCVWRTGVITTLANESTLWLDA